MHRRKFILSTTTIAGTLPVINHFHNHSYSQSNRINIIGPKEGYAPQIGTLVSMLNWMRDVVLREVNNLNKDDLDYLIDDQANTIGAMLWHLVEVERFYQRKTFEGRQWDGLSPSEDDKWQAAASLGNVGRELIKGYDLDFYLQLLGNVRAFTLEEMKNKDDQWLMTVDNNFWR